MKVRWTREGQLWLKEIYDFLKKSNGTTLAKKVVNNIKERAVILGDFPEMGQRVLSQRDKNIRMMIFGKYRVIYWIKEESLDVVAVFHASLLSYDRYLK